MKKFLDGSDLLRQYKKNFAQKLEKEFKNEKEIEYYFDMTLKLCQFEYLIDAQDSIWCKFFDKNTLELLEYKEDIKYNCKYGFKHEITQLMTCDLVKNMAQSLESFKTK